MSPDSMPKLSESDSSEDSVIHAFKASRLLEQSYSEIDSSNSEELFSIKTLAAS